MTLNEILELGKMGFTKDDILRMNSTRDQQSQVQQTQIPQSQQTQIPQSQQTQIPQSQQTQIPQPQQTEERQTVDFLDEIKKLRQEIALNFSSIRTPKEESVDDILANILKPREVK